MAGFDLNGLKDKLQSVLQTANTTTASTDLSDGLDSRVRFISKKNPDMVFTQATHHPSIHIYPDNKDITSVDIVKDQTSARRGGVYNMNIMGIYQDFNTENNDEDKAMKNLIAMMENVEQIYREDPTLGGTTGVRYQQPTGVQYGLAGYDEEAYFRVGVLSLQVKIFY